MPALTSDRNTPRFEGDLREEALAASIKVFAGAILMRNAAGYLTKGATAAGAYGVGVAQEQVDNTAGVAGAMTVTYRKGVHRFDTLAGDPVTIANLGKPCFIVDDQTVAATNGANTRSPAGIVEGIDTRGVWVRFDEAILRAS